VQPSDQRDNRVARGRVCAPGRDAVGSDHNGIERQSGGAFWETIVDMLIEISLTRALTNTHKSAKARASRATVAPDAPSLIPLS
jgi:hypothetical protein